MKTGSILQTTFEEYKVKGKIGEGGCAVVYEATDSRDNVIAIKVLDSSKITSEKLRRFKNEYAFCNKTDHAHIIKYFDSGITAKKEPFVVMPLFASSLRKLIPGMNSITAVKYTKQILKGLDAAHKLNTVHRDLKPENILYSKTNDSLVISDFGISRFHAADLITAVETKPTTRLANFAYAAPEQRTPGAHVDHNADIFSAGLIINELFTGSVPHGVNYKAIADVDPDYNYLDPIVSKMLSQDPVDRFNSVEAILIEIEKQTGITAELQKVSSLSKTVVAADTNENPLYNDPVRITDVDWNDGTLTITLSQAVNEQWRQAFLNFGSYTSVLGAGPEYFRFKGDIASVNCQESSAQNVIDHFKDWLPRATQKYRDVIDAFEERKRIDHENQLRRERERIRKNIEMKSKLTF
jgi:serine/threonine protein kinase